MYKIKGLYDETYIPKNLKGLRLYHKYTLTQVAINLDITSACLSNYENATRKPNYEMFVRLCNFYDVTPNYLFSNNNLT